MFIVEINNYDLKTRLIELSDALFQPFEINSDDFYAPIYEIDPDINFYNEIDYHIGSTCNYYMEDAFSSITKKMYTSEPSEKLFSICHLNIRSLQSNLNDFDMYLKSLNFEFSFIGVTETWLHDGNCDLYELSSYVFVERHRHTRKGGGVGIFIKDYVSFQDRNDLYSIDDMFESIFIEIDKNVFNKNSNIVIGVIYRPPNTDINCFNESLNVILDKLKNENKLCFLMGDYNINLLNSDKHNPTSDFVELMHSYSFLSLINRPTRITATSATLIDNIFVNYSDLQNSFQCILVTDISDHLPVVFIDRNSVTDSSEGYIWRRNMCQRNRQAFSNAISSFDWDEIYEETDMQTAYSLFHSKFLRLYNIHFPKQKLKLKYNTRKPWLTQGLKDAIRKKNKLYKKYLKMPSALNEITYKSYRNKLNHILKKSERQHYSDLLTANKSNIKKTWQIMKNIVNKSKIKKIQSKFKLPDGSDTENKTLISNKFNDFFINIGPNLAKNIPDLGINPLKYMSAPASHTIFLSPVTNIEIIRIIQDLKIGAPGYDEINASVLKLVSCHVVVPLVYLCNLSIDQGIFPKELKLANVLPLYKTDDPFLFNNYRPVSVLSILSKVFEKIMYSRLMEYLETYEILINNQFGFRKYHSSYMALMLLMDDLITSLEKGDIVMGVFLDFSKAFHTVNHDILLNKLEHYGIRGNALCWFQSYLTDRKQYVTYNGATSTTKTIKCGVPQGSILGPLLFLIYINDLYHVCSNCTPILFADDTNLFINGTDIDHMQSLLNAELAHISQWLIVNKLSLNVKLIIWFLQRKRLQEML